MARYVTTIHSSKSPTEAFAYMADLRNFPEWDRNIISVTQVKGDGAGMGTEFDIAVRFRNERRPRRIKQNATQRIAALD